jgi:hypothetical protein
MGIVVLSGDMDGLDRAVLMDSVTERPLALPSFEGAEDAENFLGFAMTRSRVDIRALSADALDGLHDAWIEQVAADAKVRYDVEDDGVTVPMTLPEILDVHTFAPGDVDQIRLLAPGESFEDDRFGVVVVITRREVQS